MVVLYSVNLYLVGTAPALCKFLVVFESGGKDQGLQSLYDSLFLFASDGGVSLFSEGVVHLLAEPIFLFFD